jgi:aminoglycoside phosphotransferase (APT) family kinase protein
MDFDLLYDRPTDSASYNQDRLLELVSDDMGVAHFESAVPLSGGFNNYNYAVKTHNGDRFVLRISSKPVQLSTELSVVERLGRHSSGIPVPQVLWRSTTEYFDTFLVAAMSFSEGQLLSKMADILTPTQINSISLGLGEIASAIHSIKFSDYGFLNEEFCTTGGCQDYKTWTLGYLQDCLTNRRMIDRLGQRNHNLLTTFVGENSHLLEEPTAPVLCHGDFNQKNILVQKKSNNGDYAISAILDWEYALAGCPMMDTGNLFRFLDLTSSVSPEYFCKGYKSSGGQLANNWLDQSRFTDLLALCTFLTSPEERPATYKTIAGRVFNTLSYFEDNRPLRGQKN